MDDYYKFVRYEMPDGRRRVTFEPSRTGAAWAEDELERLREMAATHTPRQIAGELRRSENAVLNKASQLKIKLTAPNDPNSAQVRAALRRHQGK